MAHTVIGSATRRSMYLGASTLLTGVAGLYAAHQSPPFKTPLQLGELRSHGTPKRLAPEEVRHLPDGPTDISILVQGHLFNVPSTPSQMRQQAVDYASGKSMSHTRVEKDKWLSEEGVVIDFEAESPDGSPAKLHRTIYNWDQFLPHGTKIKIKNIQTVTSDTECVQARADTMEQVERINNLIG